MKYQDTEFGYSFDLPDGWEKVDVFLPLTFQCGSNMIQVQVNQPTEKQPRDADARARELMAGDPGCACKRTSLLGGEENTVVCDHKSRGDGCISTIRDGVAYHISYDDIHDKSLVSALDCMRASFRFPTRQQATDALRRRADDPILQMGNVIGQLQSTAEAGRVLAGMGMPPVASGPGYTMHHVRPEPPRKYPMLTILAVHAFGGALGAYLGAKLQFEGITIHGREWTDLRYGGALLGVGAAWWFLTVEVHRWPVFLRAMLALPCLAKLCLLLTEKSVPIGILVLVSLFVFAWGFGRFPLRRL